MQAIHPNKIIFIDFNDSFTFNLVSFLEQGGFEVEVINWEKVGDSHFENYPIVLGPGPGHPNDYSDIIFFIRNWLESRKKLAGICLGHQLIFQALGFEVSRSKKPLHGHSTKLMTKGLWKSFFSNRTDIEVQRYNSLAVHTNQFQYEKFGQKFDLFQVEGEVYASKSEFVVTYQFHPESVGTSSQEIFITPLKRLFL